MVDISRLEENQGHRLSKSEIPSHHHGVGTRPARAALEGTIASEKIREFTRGISEISKALSGAVANDQFGTAAFAKQIAGLSSSMASGIADHTDALSRASRGLNFDPVGHELKRLQGLFGRDLSRSLGELDRSWGRMRDGFDAKSLSDKIGKIASGSLDESLTAGWRNALEGPKSSRDWLNELPPLPEIPQNPIHETNDRLVILAEKSDALVEIQGKQAELIDQLLLAQIANEKAQLSIGGRAHRVSIVNVILMAIFSIVAIIVTVSFAG